MKKIYLSFLVLLTIVASVSALPGYGVVKSSNLAYSGTGWGGWSVPSGVVTGGGFALPGPALASAPATPGSVWPHYTYGAGEYGWVAQNGGIAGVGNVYGVYATMPAGYQIITKQWNFGDGGYAGWSCPTGTVVLGGGYEATDSVAVSAPATPGSIWPHYTYGANEYGWVVRDAPNGASNTIKLSVICANPPAGYGVVKSSNQNFAATGWAGWSVPVGKVVTGGGFALPGPAAASAPATPGTVWPHYTYGANEYGWVVQNGGVAGVGNVYAIFADDETSTPFPEFPTMALPAVLIVGMLGAILFIQRTKQN